MTAASDTLQAAGRRAAALQLVAVLVVVWCRSSRWRVVLVRVRDGCGQHPLHLGCPECRALAAAATSATHSGPVQLQVVPTAVSSSNPLSLSLKQQMEQLVVLIQQQQVCSASGRRVQSTGRDCSSGLRRRQQAQWLGHLQMLLLVWDLDVVAVRAVTAVQVQQQQEVHGVQLLAGTAAAAGRGRVAAVKATVCRQQGGSALQVLVAAIAGQDQLPLSPLTKVAQGRMLQQAP